MKLSLILMTELKLNAERLLNTTKSGVKSKMSKRLLIVSKSCQINGIPARVAGIIKTSKECNIYAYVGTCNLLQGINERDFEPIPITEDFLLKNGFRRKEFQDHNVLMIFNLGMSIVKVETGWFINVSKANEHLHNFTEVSVLINYVHELQHILKLIGIEKEVKI